MTYALIILIALWGVTDFIGHAKLNGKIDELKKDIFQIRWQEMKRRSVEEAIKTATEQAQELFPCDCDLCKEEENERTTDND